jgi:hypothetical protein
MCSFLAYYIICVKTFKCLALTLAQVNIKCSNNRIRGSIKPHN